MFLKAFSEASILLLQDIVKYNICELAKKTKLNKKQLALILGEAKEVLKFEPK